MRHIIKFSAQELVLLESILDSPLKSTFGLWTGKYFVYVFEQEELEKMAQTVYQVQSESFNRWLDLLHAQEVKEAYTGRHVITDEMRAQWKYTGQIEEVYDRLASPIGQSKRCSPEEAQEMMEYYEKLEYLDAMEGMENMENLEPLELVEKLEGLDKLEGWNLWKIKKKAEDSSR